MDAVDTGRILGMDAGNRDVMVDGKMLAGVRETLSHMRSEELQKVVDAASQIVERLPVPGRDRSRIGLLLGKIQAGKTNAMMVTTALAVDNGFRLIIVLTSDNTWLYEQTLKRFKRTLRGMTCAGMEDWSGKRDQILHNLRCGGVVLVSTKNDSRLKDLAGFLSSLGIGEVPAVVFDDEADQASLDTNASRPGREPSTINRLISQLRALLSVHAFIQVTATPQALLLLDSSSEYRPQFTVVLEPGKDYIGGDVYFAEESPYLVRIPLDEVNDIKSEGAPSRIPTGLKSAVATFLVGASCRLAEEPHAHFSCLVHVSLKTVHHARLASMVHEYITGLMDALGKDTSAESASVADLRKAYAELETTASGLPPFLQVLETLSRFLPSTDVQVLNFSNKGRQPTYEAPYNFIIGGTKLGRGVTIDGLLVTYYGRESKSPQMDTVQQHARMYGYRASELRLSRIYLPEQLARYFRDINFSENELREWLRGRPDEPVNPILIPQDMKATRSNVLNPATTGCYIPGKSYTPSTLSLSFRDSETLTERLNRMLPRRGSERHSVIATTIDQAIGVLQLVPATGREGTWDDVRVRKALAQLQGICHNTAYVGVFWDRRLKPHEKRNVADSDDFLLFPKDFPALLMFRQKGLLEDGWEGRPFWVPVVRFPDSRYPIAFNFS